MSKQDLFERVMVHEGGAKATDDPKDAGGRTQWGISEKSNPQAWADGKVTEDEARAIFWSKYVEFPGFAKIPDSHGVVRNQLVDFGFLSGQDQAIRKLQDVLKVPADGRLGPKTLEALVACEPRTLNNLLVEARVRMLCRIVAKNPSQVRFLNGWVDRAFSFMTY